MNEHADERKERADTMKDSSLRQEVELVSLLRNQLARASEQIQSIELDRMALGHDLEVAEHDMKQARESWQMDRATLQRLIQNLRTELAQVRAGCDLLRGNWKLEQKRWEVEKTNLERDISWLKSEDKLRDDRFREMTTLTEKQSRIIESQTALQRLITPFWVVAAREAAGFLVMGPDKKTWFQSPVSLSKDPREGEANLGLCHQVCDLLNRAWGEEKWTR